MIHRFKLTQAQLIDTLIERKIKQLDQTICPDAPSKEELERAQAQLQTLVEQRANKIFEAFGGTITDLDQVLRAAGAIRRYSPEKDKLSRLSVTEGPNGPEVEIDVSVKIPTKLLPKTGVLDRKIGAKHKEVSALNTAFQGGYQARERARQQIHADRPELKRQIIEQLNTNDVKMNEALDVIAQGIEIEIMEDRDVRQGPSQYTEPNTDNA